MMNAKAMHGRTRIGEAQIDNLVQFLDPNGTGMVGYEEFFEGLRVQADLDVL